MTVPQHPQGFTRPPAALACLHRKPHLGKIVPETHVRASRPAAITAPIRGETRLVTPIHELALGAHYHRHQQRHFNVNEDQLATGPRTTLVSPGPAPPRAPSRMDLLPGKAWKRSGARHPHSRRDFRRLDRSARIIPGSPPLAQGLLAVGGVRVGRLRFTPARAGTSRPASSTACAWAVHPRSRRDFASVSTSPALVTGSPPLAQGLLAPGIPLRSVRGSPPLAQGLPDRGTGGSASRRFTPARAGTSYSGPVWTGGGSVHPRSRRDFPL